jgi:tRNA(adenine34) deaminase
MSTIFLAAAPAYSAEPSIDYRPYMQELVDTLNSTPRVGFASMIIDNKSGEVLCRGVNNGRVNPVAHSEIMAITNCAEKYGHKMRWKEATLISTAEPCAMCQGGISWAQLSTVVYGTSIPFLVQQGWRQINLRAHDIALKSNFGRVEIIPGVLHEQTDKFYTRRASASNEVLRFGKLRVKKSLFAGAGNFHEKLKACAYCHGKQALGDIEFGPYAVYATPALRGFSEKWLLQQLRAFRNGRRVHESMTSMAEIMREDDLQRFARHFASLATVVSYNSHRDYEPALLERGRQIAESGTCSSCHQSGGKGDGKLYPRLAGQISLYIRKRLLEWQSGIDAQSVMSSIAIQLKEADIEAVAMYYESLGWK